METTTNANDAYRAARERLDRQVGQINHLVLAHAEQQSKTPEHWTHAGDINHVVEVLNDVIEFLGGDDEESLRCDRCGVEVDPAAVRVPPFCDACAPKAVRL